MILQLQILAGNLVYKMSPQLFFDGITMEKIFWHVVRKSIGRLARYTVSTRLYNTFSKQLFPLYWKLREAEARADAKYYSLLEEKIF